MMATQTTRTSSGLVPYRLTVRQFSKMIDANVFREEDRVELLGGILVPVTLNLPHALAVARLAEMLRPRLPADWSLWEEKPVQLGRIWRPQPDIAVFKSPFSAFARDWPQPHDIALLVEVADTSYPKDSGIKLRRYAHVQIAQYWIVHLDRRQVEVYRDPHGRHGKAGYRMIEIHPNTVEIPVVIEGNDLGGIAVKEILP
jgi:Uma2 family endonuclease